MADPEVYVHPIEVQPEDIDIQGHVNNVVYLRYAQDAAVAHWMTAVPPEVREGVAWFVRRHEIDYLKPAYPGDNLEARTWIGKAGGATMERFIEIGKVGGEVLARMRSVWVAIDPSSGRPRRVPESLRPPTSEMVSDD
ncbi:thioesterase family protein [Isosphaeraceae bacterium EP7]